MIKNLIRKITCKGLKQDSQEMLLALDAQHTIINFLSYLICVDTICLILFVPAIPLLVNNIYPDITFSKNNLVNTITVMLCYTIFVEIFLRIFRKAIYELAESVTKRLYFSICTKKGKAISKKDFAKIKKSDKRLFNWIKEQECRGYCYFVCFKICKILRKGKLEFLAVRDFEFVEEKQKPKYTMHVLYVNNGWAFDTFSARQYPVDEIHQILGAKLYKLFDFNEIKHKSYEEFQQEEEPKMNVWTMKNDCTEYWK